jgi:hypothetical protein
METTPKKVIRVLPNGDREEVSATDLKVDDQFIDETLKQEGIVVEVSHGSVKYRLPDGTISLRDIPKLP